MSRKNSTAQAMTAVIYARYSSSVQNDASIEQQIAECQAYAEDNNLTIVSTYADRAMSGRNDNRPEFQKMMRAAERNQFQVVIAYKSNRISRNMLHALAYEDKLAKRGISVVYVKEEFGNNAAGRFALRNMMNLNQFYSENMAEDITRGLRDSAQQCRVVSSIPLGYKRGEDGKFAIDDPTAEVVLEIFTRVANGETYAEIADDLNRRGISTGIGKQWGKNSFHSIISNERYTGVYIYKDIRVENGMPVIVEKELFDRVRRRAKQKRDCQGRHQNDMDYILTGKLFCGHCGAHMVGMSGVSKIGTPYYYYSCQNRRNRHNCKKRNVRRDLIERAVAAAVKRQLLTDENIEWMADLVMEYQKKAKSETQLSYYQNKLVDVKRSITNIMKAIEAGVFTATTKNRLEELELEESTLKSQIAVEKASIPDVTREMVVFYMERFRDGSEDDPQFRKKLIDGFVTAVYLYDDRLKIVFDYAEGRNNSLESPLTIDEMAEADGEDECSPNASKSVLLEGKTNTIRLVRGVFVFTYHMSFS